MPTERQLRPKSIDYRRTIIEIIKACGTGHTAGDPSCIDILNVRYNRILTVRSATFHDPDRDYRVQSKGHCAEALFTVLANREFLPKEKLKTLNKYGSHFIGHHAQG